MIDYSATYTDQYQLTMAQVYFHKDQKHDAAIQFGIVLAAIMLLSEISRQWFGDTGIYGLSLISGMADIDSITLALLDMGGESLTPTIAANGIILAAMSNTLIKGAIFTFFIGFKDAWKLLLFCVIVVLSAVPGLFYAYSIN